MTSESSIEKKVKALAEEADAFYISKVKAICVRRGFLKASSASAPMVTDKQGRTAHSRELLNLDRWYMDLLRHCPPDYLYEDGTMHL
jgi:hypothetical protein